MAMRSLGWTVLDRSGEPVRAYKSEASLRLYPTEARARRFAKGVPVEVFTLNHREQCLLADDS